MKEISFSSTKMSSIFAPIYSSHQSLIFRRILKIFGEKTHVANFSLRVVGFLGKKKLANNNQRAIKKDVASSGQTGEEDFPLLLLLFLLLFLFLRLE
jgi:hypothetical protein